MDWPWRKFPINNSTIWTYIVILSTVGTIFVNPAYVDLMEVDQPIDSGGPYFRGQSHNHKRNNNRLLLHSASVGRHDLLAREKDWDSKGSKEEPVGPYFLNPEDAKRNITTSISQTAYLHCYVEHLGDEAQVSWIRKRDLHVLSSGLIVFASDQRFQVLHPENSKKWTLQIKYAQIRDAGLYECQVNTEPKISRSYFLSVVESHARILGPEYVKAGSTINLTCVINQPSMQSLVHWFRNGEILDYEGLVTISTRGDDEHMVSHLTIMKATTKHSGNYTC